MIGKDVPETVQRSEMNFKDSLGKDIKTRQLFCY